MDCSGDPKYIVFSEDSYLIQADIVIVFCIETNKHRITNHQCKHCLPRMKNAQKISPECVVYLAVNATPDFIRNILK